MSGIKQSQQQFALASLVVEYLIGDCDDISSST